MRQLIRIFSEVVGRRLEFARQTSLFANLVCRDSIKLFVAFDRDRFFIVGYIE